MSVHSTRHALTMNKKIALVPWCWRFVFFFCWGGEWGEKNNVWNFEKPCWKLWRDFGFITVSCSENLWPSQVGLIRQGGCPKNQMCLTTRVFSQISHPNKKQVIESIPYTPFHTCIWAGIWTLNMYLKPPSDEVIGCLESTDSFIKCLPASSRYHIDRSQYCPLSSDQFSTVGGVPAEIELFPFFFAKVN